MKIFEVEVKSFISVEADTLQEANEFMEKNYSALETVNFFEVDEAINHEVIGHCEISGLSIFEGDDFRSDSWVMWLKKFDIDGVSEPPTYEEFIQKNGLGERDLKNDITYSDTL